MVWLDRDRLAWQWLTQWISVKIWRPNSNPTRLGRGENLLSAVQIISQPMSITFAMEILMDKDMHTKNVYGCERIQRTLVTLQEICMNIFFNFMKNLRANVDVNQLTSYLFLFEFLIAYLIFYVPLYL